MSRKARRMLAAVQLPPAAALNLGRLPRVADALTAELRTATQQIAAAVAHNWQAQLLVTLPGLGALGASLVSAAIGTIDRFGSAKHLLSHFGQTQGA